MCVRDTVQMPEFGAPPAAASAGELVPTLDASVAKAKEVLGGMDDAALLATWRVTKDGADVIVVPRIGFLCQIMRTTGITIAGSSRCISACSTSPCRRSTVRARMRTRSLGRPARDLACAGRLTGERERPFRVCLRGAAFDPTRLRL